MLLPENLHAITTEIKMHITQRIFASEVIDTNNSSLKIRKKEVLSSIYIC